MYPPETAQGPPGRTAVAVELAPTTADTLRVNPAFCADLRFWLDGTAATVDTDDELFIEFPAVTGRFVCQPDETVPVGQVQIPDDLCRALDLYTLPAVQTIWCIEPAQDAQLRRFDQ